jgi:DNA-binding NarL/FixJ family response regulator
MTEFGHHALRTIAGRQRIAKALVHDTARSHRVRVTDVLGDRRFAPYVAVRRKIILRLKAMGFPLREIAETMNRDQGTVCHHIRMAKQGEPA